MCTPATELNGKRGDSTEVMCPGTSGKYAVGCYDSMEVITHNSRKHPNSGIRELERRLELTEESLGDMARARMSAGWSRGGLRD